MKPRRLITLLSLAAICPSLAIAGTQVPFKGSLALAQTGVVQGGFLIVEGSGAGNGTQLGRFAISFNEQVDLGTGIGTGTFNFVAANGDTLSASFVGQATATPDPSILILEEVGTITGGTGRFAGATGSFTLQRVFNLATGVSTGAFTGAISNPGKR